MGFLLLLFLVTFFALHSSLRRRVENLEEKVHRLQAKADTVSSVRQERPIPPPPEPTPTYAPLTPINSDVPRPTEQFAESDSEKPTATANESGRFFLYTWFKEQTLIKIGAIIFFLGAVWFVSYAIEQNWISPLMRIVLGILLSLGVYATGYLRRAVTTQYQVLTTLGTSILLGSIIASQFAFTNPVLPAALAFMIMALGVAYTLVVALMTKTEWLGAAAAVAGLIVPLLVEFNTPPATLFLT